MSSEPIGSIGCFTTPNGWLTASWTEFQDSLEDIAQGKSRACSRASESRCAIRGCSQLEERLLLWLQYNLLVSCYARGDIGPQFATTY